MSDSAEALARLFHETYERLAPAFQYETRKASAVSWGRVPKNNADLMRAVAAEVLTSPDLVQWLIAEGAAGVMLDALRGAGHLVQAADGHGPLWLIAGRPQLGLGTEIPDDAVPLYRIVRELRG